MSLCVPIDAAGGLLTVHNLKAARERSCFSKMMELLQCLAVYTAAEAIGTLASVPALHRLTL